jgi:hypothetical protein
MRKDAVFVLDKYGRLGENPDMTPTIRAVLARFDGNRESAMDYVISVARAYPHLATEYWQILDILKGARNA